MMTHGTSATLLDRRTARIGMPVFDISTQKTHSGEFSLAKQQLEEALRIQTKELLGMKREQASFALKFFELTYSSDL